MKPTKRSLSRLLIIAVAFLSLIGTGVLMPAQEAPTQKMGLVDDWTHHYLVFSNPGTAAEALAQGRFEHWYRITNDPRYQLQQLMRSFTQRAVLAAPDFAARTAILSAKPISGKPPQTRQEPIKKDWSAGLDGADQTGSITVGTLSSSTVSSSSTLTVGSVTFDASPPTPASGTLTMGSSPPATGTTLVIGGITYNFSTSTLSTTQSADTCGVYQNGSRSTTTGNLVGAMTDGASGNGVGTTSWECNSDVPTDTKITVTAYSTTSHTITVASTTPGSGSSITYSLGTTGFTWGSAVAGTDGTTSGTATPPTFAYWSGTTYVSSSQLATNLAATINENTTLQGSGGVIASANGDVVTITARNTGTTAIALTDSSFTALTLVAPTGGAAGTGTVQPNAFPAKYGASLTSASCSGDFAVYPTGKAGSSSSANIVAFNNLYTTGCTGAVPSVYWAYNTGAYSVSTAPVISGNSSKIAFIQSNGTAAQLVVLTWAANSSASLGSPVSLTSNSSYPSCTAPCMIALPLYGSTNDSFSAPYYDFATDDALYVGDDSGNLHKFIHVFTGTPVEVASSSGGCGATCSWPTALKGYAVSSPVWDPSSNCVFVGDVYGYLYSVQSGGPGGSTCSSTAGTIYATSENLGGGATGDGIYDAPLVDSTAGMVYVFVTAASGSIGNCSTAGGNCVYQFHTAMDTMSAVPNNEEPLGTGGAHYNLYAGQFDNVYYSSSAPSGSLYAIGNTGVTTGATLYRVPISSNAMSSPASAVTGLTSTLHPWPSPLTEFCNNGASACAVTTGGSCGTGVTCTTSGTDYVFFSVNRGTPSGCTNATGDGCILSYKINTTTPSLSGSGLNVTNVGTNGCWATSGLIIDNSDTTTTGAQQIYFVGLNGVTAGGPAGATSSGCTTGSGTASINAVQASQASP